MGLLAVTVDGMSQLMSPSEARAANIPLKVLSLGEVTTLEAFGEVLLPGAAAAGLSHYLDYHLAVPHKDCMLMLRNLDWPAPYAPFYKAGLAGLETVAQAKHKRPFAQLTPVEANTLVAGMVQGTPDGWQGIPAPLFYFVVRSDAVDVVYGTEEGFAKLNFPYMAHITPPRPW